MEKRCGTPLLGDAPLLSKEGEEDEEEGPGEGEEDDTWDLRFQCI